MDERTTYWRPAEPKPSKDVVILGGIIHRARQGGTLSVV